MFRICSMTIVWWRFQCARCTGFEVVIFRISPIQAEDHRGIWTVSKICVCQVFTAKRKEETHRQKAGQDQT